jgi:Cu2+-exporting ATPase
LALATIVFVYGGFPFLQGLVQEVSDRQPGMMTLVAMAITVAFVYSAAVILGLPGKTFLWELATLVVVMLFGHWVEMKSVVGASRATEELAKLLPDTAHRMKENGSTEDVPASELQEGDTVLVKPGEKFPADGKITKGQTSADESLITGESKAVSKEEGSDVVGGAVNGDGAVEVEIESAGEGSYLSQISKLVQEAQASKSRSQRLADKAALWLTIIAVGAGLLTLSAWLILMQTEFSFALERMVTVMVTACPHALGLAIPLVVAVSAALAARNGLLIRKRGPFESARRLDVVVFDKTGTLTEGSFEVSDVVPIGEMSEKDLLSLAAAVEAKSEHPIGAAIEAAADEVANAESFEAIPGKGAKAVVDGRKVLVVGPNYLKENDIKVDDQDLKEIAEQGKTVTYVLIENELKGGIGLDDPVRERSRDAVARLRKLGVESRMITGDSEAVARRVAEDLNIDDYSAGVLPDKKAEVIKEIQSQGRSVAMVGDGINDAPALAQADVGIAIGAGTDVAAETADIILVRNDPMDVVNVISHAKATYKKMVQNLIWATGYNAVALPLAAGVLYSAGILLSPAMGALIMSGSTVIVAVNARLLPEPKLDELD